MIFVLISWSINGASVQTGFLLWHTREFKDDLGRPPSQTLEPARVSRTYQCDK